MVPPLLERLGLRVPEQPLTAAVAARPDRGLMARSLMYLYAIGGVMTLLTLLVHAPAAEGTRIATTAACALGMALFLFLAYDRTPEWSFDTLLASGSVLIEWA